MAESPVQVCLIYATESVQEIMSFSLSSGSTARDLIDQSGILEKYSEIDLSQQAIGIFSRKVGLDEVLKDGDRLEIYRPLLADPKQARLKRVVKKKAKK